MTFTDNRRERRMPLNILLNKLSSMRGKESRYLKPLMSKMEGLVGYELNTTTLPLPNEPQQAAFPSTVQIPAIFAPSVVPPAPQKASPYVYR